MYSVGGGTVSFDFGTGLVLPSSGEEIMRMHIS